MLLNNFSTINIGPGRYSAGPTNLYLKFKPGSMYNWFVGDHLVENSTIKDSFPTATSPPYSYVLGDAGSLLSSTTFLKGYSNLSSRLASGKALNASIDGTGAMTTDLSLTVMMVCSILASSSTDIGLKGRIEIASELAGAGDLEGSLSLISQIICDINGDSNLSASLTGIANMDAELYVNQSQASTVQIVRELWNAIATEFNTAGTMGAKLNSASSAGDPWGTTLPGAYSAGTAGYIVGTNLPEPAPTAAEILSSGDIDGYSLEETMKICLAALAGKLSGVPGSTITIKAADDSKTRITASVSGGNRTSITLDAT